MGTVGSVALKCFFVALVGDVEVPGECSIAL